jgi:hypothetical protein
VSARRLTLYGMQTINKIMKGVPIIFLLLRAFPVEGKVLQPSTPANYVGALQAVDSFLWAWVNRDADAGLKLISQGLLSKLKNTKTEKWFTQYMVGLSNPHHLSFEIGPGKEINPKRFVFPVTLYEYYTGEPKAFKYNSKIELVREGDLWRVDVLPLTSDNQ